MKSVQISFVKQDPKFRASVEPYRMRHRGNTETMLNDISILFCWPIFIKSKMRMLELSASSL